MKVFIIFDISLIFFSSVVESQQTGLHNQIRHCVTCAIARNGRATGARGVSFPLKPSLVLPSVEASGTCLRRQNTPKHIKTTRQERMRRPLTDFTIGRRNRKKGESSKLQAPSPPTWYLDKSSFDSTSSSQTFFFFFIFPPVDLFTPHPSPQLAISRYL